ncbi:MAG: AMP-binding protein, partial [Desulfobacterales bacterium]
MSIASLGSCFAETFLACKNKTAITFLRDGKVETELSYLELYRDTNRLANGFLAQGVKKGDRVILLIQKSVVFVVAHLALQKIGAVTVPLNTGFKKSELQYLLGDADASLILTEPGKEALIGGIDPNLTTSIVDTRVPYHDLDIFGAASEEYPPVVVRPADPALIIYTSGTTGKPKGAILTHQNLLHDARNIINIWKISE